MFDRIPADPLGRPARTPRSSLPGLGVGLGAAALLWAPPAAAASGDGFSGLMLALALLGPLGISPAITLGLIGATMASGAMMAVPGLEWMAHPVAFLPALAAGIGLTAGRSTLLSKPFAGLFGLGESLFGVLSALMMFWAVIAQPGGNPTLGWLALVLAPLGLTALITVRTASDVLTWLSPIPFLDAAFQALKLALTVGLFVLALYFPWAALALSTLLTLGAATGLRWSTRAAKYGIITGRDIIVSRFTDKAALPMDAELSTTDLGPFFGFAFDINGVPQRTAGELELVVDRWYFSAPSLTGEPERIFLAEAKDTELESGWLGLTLKTEQGAVVLPPRYKHLAGDLIQRRAVRTTATDAPAKLSRQNEAAKRAKAKQGEAS